MPELNQYYTSKPISDLLASLINLKNVKTCIELSAGEGALIDAILAHSCDIDFFTVDIDPKNVQYLKLKYPKFTHICADALNLSTEIKNKKFDLAICNPPFAQVNINEKITYLFDDELSKIFSNQKTIRMEIVFLILNLNILKYGATLSIIVPDVIINSDRLARFRSYIFSKFTLVNLVECKHRSFKKTEAKTFIVYIKNSKPKAEQYNYTHYYFSNSEIQSERNEVKNLYENFMPTKNIKLKIFRGKNSSKECRKLNEDFYHTSVKIKDFSILSFDESINESNKHSYAIAGDILINRVGRDVGKTTYLNSGRIIISDCIIAIRFSNNIDSNKFITIWRHKKEQWLVKNAKGTCAKHISIKNISKFINENM